MYISIQPRTPATGGGAIATGSESVATGLASWGSPLYTVLIVLGVLAIVGGILLCLLNMKKKDNTEKAWDAAGSSVNRNQWYGSGGGTYQPVKSLANGSDEELRRERSRDDRYPPMAAMRGLRSPTVTDVDAQYQRRPGQFPV